MAKVECDINGQKVALVKLAFTEPVIEEKEKATQEGEESAKEAEETGEAGEEEEEEEAEARG